MELRYCSLQMGSAFFLSKIKDDGINNNYKMTLIKKSDRSVSFKIENVDEYTHGIVIRALRHEPI